MPLKKNFSHTQINFTITLVVIIFLVIGNGGFIEIHGAIGLPKF